MNKLTEEVSTKLLEEYQLKPYLYLEEGIILSTSGRLSLEDIFSVENLIGGTFVTANTQGSVFLFRWSS